MECADCKEKIAGDAFIVVKRTKGSPSTIARYPSMRVCLDCYEDGIYTPYGEEEVEGSADEIQMVSNFEVIHICSNCQYEYTVVTEERDAKIIVATSMCPQCKRIDKLYLTIKRV